MQPQTFELIAESADELQELGAFLIAAGLELLCVIVIAVDPIGEPPTRALQL